jgi:Lrp/AsnC family leucine-responsive transcriptional regulator
MNGIDPVDYDILRALQDNARTSNAEIARQIGLTPSAVFQRIRKLEENGIIRGYTAQLDPRALGFGLVAFVMVRTGDGGRTCDTIAPLLDIPEVQEVHRVVGEDCFFVKVRVRDTDALARLLDDRIQTIPSVSSTRTAIVLNTARESLALPLP